MSFEVFHLYYKYFDYINEGMTYPIIFASYYVKDPLTFYKTNCLETVRRFYHICYPDIPYKPKRVINSNKAIEMIKTLLQNNDRIFFTIDYHRKGNDMAHAICVIKLNNYLCLLESNSMKNEKKLITIPSIGFLKPDIQIYNVGYYKIPSDDIVKSNIKKIIARSVDLKPPLKNIHEAIITNDETRLDKENVRKELSKDKKMLKIIMKEAKSLIYPHDNIYL